MGEEEKKLITVREAAQECGRNAETVRRWIWSGKLPAEKLGNQLFIRRSDFATYCRETAVKYRAEPEADFLERAGSPRNGIRAATGTAFDAAEEVRRIRGEWMNELGARGVEPTDAADEIRRMREEQMNELGAKGVGPTEFADEIRRMRGGRMDEPEARLQGDANMRYETEAEKKEDFIERAIRFRNRLKMRGYPEVNTAELVKKSREGRINELRQSLR